MLLFITNLRLDKPIDIADLQFALESKICQSDRGWPYFRVSFYGGGFAAEYQVLTGHPVSSGDSLKNSRI